MKNITKRPGVRLLALLLTLSMILMLLPLSAFAEDAAILLSNGDFETGDSSNWTLHGFSEVKQDTWANNNTTYMLNLWLSDSEAADGSASYTVALTAGTYQFSFDLSGAASASGLSYSVTAGDSTLVSGSEPYTTTGWDNWTTYTTDEFHLAEDMTVTFTLSGTVPAGYWGYLDNLTLTGTGSAVSGSDSSVPAADDLSITIPYVPGTDGDFIRGVDISSLLSVLNSGAHYYDWDHNMLGNANDVDSQGVAFMQLLADSGVNWVRLRVWNDPYDADGNGYGGGNNDIDAAVIMGKWATAAGLRVLIDFHYSDFWADPGKQTAPKAWSSLSTSEKATALGEYTTECLTKLKDAGVDVGMVQIGNETTGGIAGVTGTANMCTLFSAGAAAVREFNSSIKVVIHITNPEKGNLTTWAKNLSNNSVDYDILATSYYPYWHGTLDNLTSQMQTVINTYGKDVMVAETSWAYTLKDGDGHENSIVNDYSNYATSVQGQASEVAGVAQAVVDGGGIGVFYWEPAWIPVNNVSELSGDAYDAQVAANKVLWETYGSGWASSYAGAYSSDAATWFGGSSWDNQAMFDFDGYPLESLLVWKYMQEYLGDVELKIESVTSPALSYYAGDTLSLPTTVQAFYNTGTSVNVSVTWNAADVAKVDMDTAGVYTVRGTIEGSDLVVVCTVTVLGANLLSNPSFESGNTGYTLSSTWAGNKIVSESSQNNAYTGSYYLHFYSGSAFTATADHDAVTLEPGTYSFALIVHGENVTGNIYAKDSNGNTLGTADFTGSGWQSWQNPSFNFEVTEETDVTVGIYIDVSAGGWGGIDDFYLSQLSSGSEDLQTLIDEANALNPLDYTGASWAALQACLADPDLTADVLRYAIDNLEEKSSDMALGSDISACAKKDKSYNNENGESKPMYQLITEDYGYNMVRLRTWTGNEDGSVGKNTIIAYAKKCADAGLQIMIDFHYADNWADPGKQPAPSEWAVSGTSAEEADRVATLLYNYTYDFLTDLIEAGVYPEWVQVGNEIDNGMVWDLGRTTYMENLVKLLQAGTDAVRDASPTTKVVIHRSSGAETENVLAFYRNLITYGYTDFDVIGLSFYPYDMDPTALIVSLGETFDALYEEFCKDTDREIMVVEIGSNYMEGNGATYNQGYNMIVNVINLLKKIPDGRGTGCMYWEIQNYEYKSSRPTVVWKAFSPNAQLINDTPVEGLTLSASSLNMQVNDAQTLTVTYTPAKPDITALIWTSSNPEVATVNNAGLVLAVGVGEATITAAATDGSNVIATCTVTVTPETAGLKNPGFELGDQYWVIDEEITGNAKISNSDNHLAGSYSLHYAGDSNGLDVNFYQEITGLTPGTYTLSCRVMGDKGVSTGYLYATSSEGTFTSSAWQTKDWTSDASGWITVTLENIVVRADGKLTVGATVSSDNTTGAPWGDFDEFSLVLVEAAVSHEHTWGDWEVTKAPTATEAGEETRTCPVCGETETREIAALGEDPDIDHTDPSDSTDTGSTTSPGTGDGFNLVLCIALMAVSLCAAASIVVINRKKYVR
ncbi:MAG: glycosyl hydrolase 53 family protein [Oscillospiraceae bacterium]|nr:glycosyl hydrolase 53 family protein [Oscillospiraceae bacterium]